MTRVLIVEDSSTMRSYVRTVLEDVEVFADPIEVDEACNGFEAMRLLPRRTYDLLITDINMPDINGLELIKLVRSNEHYRNTAVMIISTQASERDRLRGLSLGADFFLPKPFTPEALVLAIGATLAARKPPAQPEEPR